jgi:mRNA interferase MazF
MARSKTARRWSCRSCPQYGDLLVGGISTQVHQAVAGFDETIRPGDPDFVGSGLKRVSVIRLGFLVVLPASGEVLARQPASLRFTSSR